LSHRGTYNGLMFVLQAKMAEEDCSRALNLETDNVKALFRRAQARKVRDNYLYAPPNSITV